MFAFNHALLWASAFALVSCRNDSQDVQRIHRAPQGPSSIQYGISVVYSDTSEFHWSLKALKLEEQRLDGTAQSEVFSGDVTAVQLLRSKPTGTKLRADRVVRNIKDQVWVLSGSVLVTKGSNKYLKTESLEWDRRTGKIQGSGWVEINDEGQTLSGIGFEAMEDLSTYSIFEVSGQFDSN